MKTYDPTHPFDGVDPLYLFVAVDSNGTVWAFENEPRIDTKAEIWVSPYMGGRWTQLGNSPIPADWKKSLQQRPQESVAPPEAGAPYGPLSPTAPTAPVVPMAPEGYSGPALLPPVMPATKQSIWSSPTSGGIAPPPPQPMEVIGLAPTTSRPRCYGESWLFVEHDYKGVAIIQHDNDVFVWANDQGDWADIASSLDGAKQQIDRANTPQAATEHKHRAAIRKEIERVESSMPKPPSDHERGFANGLERALSLIDERMPSYKYFVIHPRATEANSEEPQDILQAKRHAKFLLSEYDNAGNPALTATQYLAIFGELPR